MRRIAVWAASTAVVLMLLFSYRTSTAGPQGPPGEIAAGPGAITGPSTTAVPDAAAGTGHTYDGSVASTRYGPVQVRVTIAAGRLTDVVALQVPNGNRRDRDINARAVPTLRQEALARQGADINTVSGATYTSDGYRRSLQAALDTAHF